MSLVAQAAVERPSEKSGRSLHFRQTEGFGLLPKEACGMLVIAPHPVNVG